MCQRERVFRLKDSVKNQDYLEMKLKYFTCNMLLMNS